MSYSMLGGTGMGAAGTGMGQGPAMGGALSPQVMAMLQMMGQRQGGAAPVQPGGMQPMQGAPGPAQAPTGGTPMAGMLGAPPGGMMQHPAMPPPAGQPPGMQGGAGAPAPAAGVSPQMLQMMQMLKQQAPGQSGVPAMPSQINPAQNPNSTMPAGLPPWLQSMLGGGALPPGAGPAGGLT
jgi:hypothetical protein